MSDQITLIKLFKKMVKPQISLSVIGSFLVFFLILSSCGDPRISVRDRVVYSRDMGELDSPSSQYIPLNYLIGPGDELEILYHIDPGVEVDYYKIDTEDTIRVEFFYYPNMNTTIKVRPDGRITMPLIGEVEADKQTPTELAKKLEKLYKNHITRPAITVDVLDFNVKIAELKEAIRTYDRGQSRRVVVRPDGGISLPYVDDTQVAGFTSAEASGKLITKYRKYLNNLSVTVAVLAAHSNRCYIMGEVNAVNFYELIGPTTVSQAVAMANGFTNEANTKSVVVISRDDNGKPAARVLNMDDIIGKGDIGADFYVRQYDVIFVPRTKIAQGALVANRLWSFIPAQFSATYSLGGTATD